MDWEPWHRIIFCGVLFVVLVSGVCYCNFNSSKAARKHAALQKIRQCSEVNGDTTTPYVTCEDVSIYIDDETPYCSECNDN